MWRRNPSSPDPRITSRVEKMAQADLIAWADQAIYSTGRSLTAYQRTDDDSYLNEAHTGAQVLLAIVNEVARRSRS